MPGTLAVGLGLGHFHRRQPSGQLGAGFTGNSRPVRQVLLRRDRATGGQFFAHRLDVIDGHAGAPGQGPQRRHAAGLGFSLLGLHQIEPRLGFVDIGDRTLAAFIKLFTLNDQALDRALLLDDQLDLVLGPGDVEIPLRHPVIQGLAGHIEHLGAQLTARLALLIGRPACLVVERLLRRQGHVVRLVIIAVDVGAVVTAVGPPAVAVARGRRHLRVKAATPDVLFVPRSFKAWAAD